MAQSTSFSFPKARRLTRALNGAALEMKANSPASYRLSIRYHRPKNTAGAELCEADLGFAELAPPSTLRHRYSKSLLPREFRRRLREKENREIYGVGDVSAAGDSVVVAGDSVVEAGLVASVVAVAGLVAAGLAAGSVVSVFCSHAASSAALARMQMYFFIMLIGRAILL